MVQFLEVCCTLAVAESSKIEKWVNRAALFCFELGIPRPLTVFSLIQRDPKGIAKKNGAQRSQRDDIFSQLPPILRSAW